MDVGPLNDAMKALGLDPEEDHMGRRPPELPGERARRWFYAIASVATATALVLTVATDVPWWPMAAMGLLGALVAAMGVHQQRVQEQAALAPPEPSPELHSAQCDTPGCTCREPVPSYCAGCDQVIEDERHMGWSSEGLWRCRGCLGTDIAPDPGLAPLLDAVAKEAPEVAYIPLVASVPCRDDEPSLSWTRENLDMYAAASWGLHTQELPNKRAVLDAIEAAEEEAMAGYQQVRADGVVLRDWGSSRRVTG